MKSLYYIYPYKRGSHSARELAKALGGKVLKLQGSKVDLRGKRVVNWGASQGPKGILNAPYFVRIAGNKLLTFQHLSHKDYGRPTEPRIPDWTTDRSVATGWLKKDGVVCRTTLTGHSGAGIIIVEKGETNLPSAPLYVKYIPKDSEYRVHIFNKEVIDVQRKIRDPSETPSNWHVRSHSNGFIFVRTGFTTPTDVSIQAQRAMSVSGLVFGAVDLVWNEKRQMAYVLEINTAPGLEGTSITNYANAVRKYYETST